MSLPERILSHVAAKHGPFVVADSELAKDARLRIVRAVAPGVTSERVYWIIESEAP